MTSECLGKADRYRFANIFDAKTRFMPQKKNQPRTLGQTGKTDEELMEEARNRAAALGLLPPETQR